MFIKANISKVSMFVTACTRVASTHIKASLVFLIMLKLSRICINRYGFFSTHCINDFDLGGSEVSGGNCEERRELKPNAENGEHETVIISQHEVL